MTLDAAAPPGSGVGASGRDPVKSAAAAVLPSLVAFWVFSGGFVLIEPSPYEVIFILVFGVALLSGLWLYRGTLNLFLLLVIFLPFAIIAAFQPRHFELKEIFIYLAITLYLWITAYFTANFIAESPGPRVKLVMKAYTAVAVLMAVIGTLAYLGLMPLEEYFLRYGRAKATFQDPNVYGPFLILPAIYAAQKVFLARGRTAFFAALTFAILFVGLFVSFSRGAWGSLLAASVLSFFLVFVLEARAKDKVRMLLIALAGVAAMILMLAVLLSIDNVRDLFLDRFSLAENYDTGATGRFGRQAYAVDLALSNPWGIGPKEFTALRITEEPHNTYVNVILIYGWGGGLAFITMIGMTLWRAIRHLMIRSPHRLFLIALTATYVPLILEAGIIDIDHWRHFYLLTGLIWGVTTAYRAGAGDTSAGYKAQPAFP